MKIGKEYKYPTDGESNLPKKGEQGFQTLHGERNTRLYKTWAQMKSRCYNKNESGYKWYGAKGIKVFDEWHTYSNFAKWAKINGYNDNLTIDRIDPAKDYSPANCQWITLQENARKATNRASNSTCVKIDIDEASEICEAYATGLFTQYELADAVGVKRATIADMVRKAGLTKTLGRKQLW